MNNEYKMDVSSADVFCLSAVENTKTEQEHLLQMLHSVSRGMSNAICQVGNMDISDEHKMVCHSTEDTSVSQGEIHTVDQEHQPEMLRLVIESVEVERNAHGSDVCEKGDILSKNTSGTDVASQHTNQDSLSPVISRDVCEKGDILSKNTSGTEVASQHTNQDSLTPVVSRDVCEKGDILSKNTSGTEVAGQHTNQGLLSPVVSSDLSEKGDILSKNTSTTEVLSQHTNQDTLSPVVSSDESAVTESDKNDVSNKYVYRHDSDSDSVFSLGGSLSSSSISSISDDETNTYVTKNNEMRTKGELRLQDLPKIEDLNINVPESEIERIGTVLDIVEQLVVVQAFKNSRPLDLDSVLFLGSGKPLGRVFETLGPVVEPHYTVRFNSKEEIEEKGICKHDPVYFAPNHTEITSYVFLESLQKEKGSDASWKDNNEPPVECLDYSDDEQERTARLKRRAKNRRSMDANYTTANRKVYSSQYVQNVPQEYNANPQQSTTRFPSMPERNYFQKSLASPVFHPSQRMSTPPSFSFIPDGSVQINAAQTSVSHNSSPFINQGCHRTVLPSPPPALRPALPPPFISRSALPPPPVFRPTLPPPPVFRPALPPPPVSSPALLPPTPPISRPPLPPPPPSEFNAFPRTFSVAEQQNQFPVPVFTNTSRHVLVPPASPIVKPPAFNHAPPPSLISVLRLVPPPNMTVSCLSSGPSPNIPLSPGFSGFPRPSPPSGTMLNSSPRTQNTDIRVPFAPVVSGFQGQSPSPNPCFSSPLQHIPACNMPCQQFQSPAPPMCSPPTSSGHVTGTMYSQLLPPQPSAISQAQINMNSPFLNTSSQQTGFAALSQRYYYGK